MEDEFYSALGVGLLAFVRIFLIFAQAPILGSKHFKPQVKAGLAGAMTLVAFPNIPVPAEFPEDPRGFLLAILSQVLVGLAIGFSSYLVMAAAQFGGEMMVIQMGLSVAASMDPSSGGTSKLLMRLNFYIAMMLYLGVNAHHDFLRALFHSFQVIPVTEFQISGPLIEQFVHHTEQIFLIGLQIAAPPLAALFITQVAMGLLSKAAPQMNVFMLSFPLNIGVGMMLFSVGLPQIQELLLRQFEVNNATTLDVISIIGDPSSPSQGGFLQVGPTPSSTASPMAAPPPLLPDASPTP